MGKRYAYVLSPHEGDCTEEVSRAIMSGRCRSDCGYEVFGDDEGHVYIDGEDCSLVTLEDELAMLRIGHGYTAAEHCAYSVDAICLRPPTVDARGQRWCEEHDPRCPECGHHRGIETGDRLCDDCFRNANRDHPSLSAAERNPGMVGR